MTSILKTNLFATDFDTLLDQQGYKVKLYEHGLCPCIQIDRDGSPDIGCALCNGKGSYWFNEQTTVGLITSVMNEKSNMQFGEWALGSVYVTTKSGYPLSYRDKVVNTESILRFSEVLERGAVQDSDFRYEPIAISLVRDVANVYDVTTHWTQTSTGITWEAGEGPAAGVAFTVVYTYRPVWIVLEMVNAFRDTQEQFRTPTVTFKNLPTRAIAKLEFMVT
jgi:hypothetical protein